MEASAKADYKVMSSHTKSVFDAYAAGVNARLQEINHRALGRGAPEMFLFNAPVAPWQPGDSLAIIKLIAQFADKLGS